MKQNPIPYVCSVFVCTRGDQGAKCRGGKKLCAHLKKEVKRRKLHHEVRVYATSCMKQCDAGPNVMIFPDNIALSRVKERDIDEILEHLMTHLYRKRD